MTASLRRVLVSSPALHGDFAAAGWRQPEPVLLERQHEAFCELLDELGCEVIVAPAPDRLVDAVFTYDPVFVTGAGSIVLQMAKPQRQAEPERLAAACELAGVPVAARLSGAARADGGDLFWVDDRTLAAGRGYRTNAEAHRQLADLLAREGATLERCDLPHDRGAGHVLHLLSVVSPVADDLAVVFEPLAPVSLLELLDERGIRRVPIDADEYETIGCNVLAVRPGVVVVADGNPNTRRALEAVGVEVHEYAASELSKGDGGPTCLTRPLLRQA
ncbi:MAG: dimethylargininase [Gaiellaceae bacterium]|nr:dimethylargininase [Gaiellaceae bacterium]